MADEYVQNILQKWNLSFLIPKFRDEGINTLAFRTLDNAKISDLIPNEGIRKTFKSKFSVFKPLSKVGMRNQNSVSVEALQPEEMDLTEPENDHIEPKSELQSSSFDIEFILSESSVGKQIIDTYASLGHLDYSSSMSLAYILIDFLISQSDDYKIDDDVLDEISVAIISRFPNEKKDVYYELYGNKPRGRLVQCYQTARKKLLKQSKQSKGPNTPGTSNGAMDAQTSQFDSPREGQAPIPEWVEVDPGSNEEMVNLKWDSHKNNLLQGLPHLLANEKFVDATIICEGQSIKCHKVVLSSYSTYFEKMLLSSPCKHPVIFLADLKFWEIQALIDFMYMGELNIEESKLPRLFAVATKFCVEGLANIDVNDNAEFVNEAEDSPEEVEETEEQEETEIDDARDPLYVPPNAPSRKRKKTNILKPSGSTLSVSEGTKKNKSFQETEILKQLLMPDAAVEENITCLLNPLDLLTGDNSLQDIDDHIPELFPISQKRKRVVLRQCYVCMRACMDDSKRKSTSYQCSKCKVALCLYPCFKKYHIQYNK